MCLDFHDAIVGERTHGEDLNAILDEFVKRSLVLFRKLVQSSKIRFVDDNDERFAGEEWANVAEERQLLSQSVSARAAVIL